MRRADIVALAERRQEALNRHDAPALALLHAEDGELDSPLAGRTACGRDEIEEVYRSLFSAFSTVSIRHQEILVDGDRAVVVARMDGTDRGGLMGLSPTGRPFSLTIVSLCEFRDGLIARERRVYDFTGLLLQIGVIKAKPV
jgi:steroid delta-isomerase-like uncharacterized protein